MHQRDFWKQLPFPITRLRPWLLLSVALHAAIFVAPLVPSPPPSLPEPEDTVNLAPRPPLPSTSPAPLPTVTTATPSPSVTVPVPQSPPRPVLPPQVPPRVARPNPPKAATPAVPLPSPAATPSPTPVPSPSPSLSPTPLPVVASPPSESPGPYATFPHVEGTSAGCGGRENCWQSADTQWRSLARTLEQNLQDQGYSVTQLDLETDTGVRVYRVTKASEPAYYLNLISTFQGTVYLISEQPMTALEIRQAAERQPGS